MGVRLYRDLVVRGEVFPTAAAAAARFGVSADTVRIAARKGTLHRVGTGAVGSEPFPVRIRGVVYPSARAAAKALGVSPGAVWQALAQGDVDRIGLGPRCHRPHRSRAITLGGMRFASMAAADRALGFSPGYIAHSLRRGRRSALERIMAAAMARAEGRRGKAAR